MGLRKHHKIVGAVDYAAGEGGGKKFPQATPSVTPVIGNVRIHSRTVLCSELPRKPRVLQTSLTGFLPCGPIHSPSPSPTQGQLDPTAHSWHLPPSATHHCSLCRAWHLSRLDSVLAPQLLSSDFYLSEPQVLNKTEIVILTSRPCWGSDEVMDGTPSQYLEHVGTHSVGLLLPLISLSQPS